MDPNKKMMVEFLGQMEGGRWLVRLERKESQKDLSKFLLDRKFCVGVADPPSSFPVLKEQKKVLGTCCLAKHGKEFFRAEITEVSEDQQKVSVFLIDYGNIAVVEVSELKVLPLELSISPGLVMLCHRDRGGRGR